MKRSHPSLALTAITLAALATSYSTASQASTNKPVRWLCHDKYDGVYQDRYIEVEHDSDGYPEQMTVWDSLTPRRYDQDGTEIRRAYFGQPQRLSAPQDITQIDPVRSRLLVDEIREALMIETTGPTRQSLVFRKDGKVYFVDTQRSVNPELYNRQFDLGLWLFHCERTRKFPAFVEQNN